MERADAAGSRTAMRVPRVIAAVGLMGGLAVAALVTPITRPSRASASNRAHTGVSLLPGLPTSGTVATTPPVVEVVNEPPSDAQTLSALLPDSAPGYVVVPVGLDNVGSLTVDAISQLARNPAAAAQLLTKDGFQGAFKKAFVARGSGVALFCYVYEFGTGDGAVSWIGQQLLGARLDGAEERTVPPGGGDGYAYRVSVATSNGGSQTQSRVIFAVGRHAFVFGAASETADAPALDAAVTPFAVAGHDRAAAA